MAASCNRKVVTTAVAASVAAAAKAAADPTTALIVPESLLLKDAMKEADFQQFPVRTRLDGCFVCLLALGLVFVVIDFSSAGRAFHFCCG